MSVCVCVCARARARTCVRAYVCVWGGGGGRTCVHEGDRHGKSVGDLSINPAS